MARLRLRYRMGHVHGLASRSIHLRKNDMKNLTCACCGENAGHFEQYNRDTGFGLCVKWVWLSTRNVSDDEILDYGIEGVNYAARD
jgi:hypothetical protein